MTPADIKARYPEMASFTDPQIQIVITDAVPWFDVDRWGGFYEQGVAAFVAHTLTVDKRTAAGGGNAASGPQSQKSVGDVSVSYAVPQFTKPTDAFWATTGYGQRYLQLRRLVGLGALAV